MWYAFDMQWCNSTGGIGYKYYGSAVTPTDTNVPTAGKAKGGGSPTSEGSLPSHGGQLFIPL